jgi:uncharacterized phage-associated protein
MYDSKAVANALLDLAKEDGASLSLMQLIKLVYIAHGWHLALSGQPLVVEAVEAWRYGPVIPSIYKHFSRKAGIQIGDYRCRKLDGLPLRIKDDQWGNWSQELLHKTWTKYKRFTPLELSSMTHQQGTPWSEVVKPYGDELPHHLAIPNELIKKHYEELSSTHGG